MTLFSEREFVYGIDALGQTVRAQPRYMGNTSCTSVKRREFVIDETYRGLIDEHRCLFYREVDSIHIEAIFHNDNDGENLMIEWDEDSREDGEECEVTFETLGPEKIFIGIADTKVHIFMGDDVGFFRSPLPNVFHSDFTVCMGDSWYVDEEDSLVGTLERAIKSINESTWNHDIVADYPPVWDSITEEIRPLDSYLPKNKRAYIMQ